jgi:lysophospholipid acyltransferase (LPLAT)-like uncharacterized protein
MKLRHPGLIRGLALLGSWLIRGWMRTLRFRIDDRASGRHPTDPTIQPCIYAFWHESLLFPTLFPTPVHVLISQHADGEFIAQACHHLGIGTVRGSSRRGGSQALLEMLRLCKGKHLAITPDGPRGPRRRVQPGVIFLASRSGLPIVPFGVGYTHAWRAGSWDRFAVPWPFSSIRCVVAPPVTVPGDLDLAGLEHYRRHVEALLLYATEEAERWAAGKPRAQRPWPTLSTPPLLHASA